MNNTENLSPGSKQAYAALLAHVESREVMNDGSAWGSVYLDNAKPGGWDGRRWAGHLSALKAAGLYRPIGPPEGLFGDVRIES